MGTPLESSPAGGGTRGWSPRDRVHGRIRPPGSKSIAQRAILLAVRADPADRDLELRGLGTGRDVEACLGVASSLGARVRRASGGTVHLRPHKGPWPTSLEVGESATLARFTTALAALHGGGAIRVGGEGTLRRRRSPSLVASLEEVGARLRPESPEGLWPLEITPRSGESPEKIILRDPVSSQEVSALWIAGAWMPAGMRVVVDGTIPSRSYLDLTRMVLDRFGVRVVGADTDARIAGVPHLPPTGFSVEPDASGAAVALAAGCLSGGRVEVEGIGPDSVQGDTAIVEHLRAFGCTAERDHGQLVAKGRPRCGAHLDLSATPDLAPVLVAVAAGAALFAGASSRFDGLGTLRGKESDRVAALAEVLRAADFDAREESDAIEVHPSASARRGRRVLDPRGDHRIAFAIALLGLLRPGIRCARAACVEKSWPGFWGDLEALGAGS
ncbi:MAG TPA: hypothetical protein ENJ09_09515 [Planctomycetes bacterium]|nr:hypothetical protein [Planctomycetota bacterium]